MEYGCFEAFRARVTLAISEYGWKRRGLGLPKLTFSSKDEARAHRQRLEEIEILFQRMQTLQNRRYRFNRRTTLGAGSFNPEKDYNLRVNMLKEKFALELTFKRELQEQGSRTGMYSPFFVWITAKSFELDFEIQETEEHLRLAGCNVKELRKKYDPDENY